MVTYTTTSCPYNTDTRTGIIYMMTDKFQAPSGTKGISVGDNGNGNSGYGSNMFLTDLEAHAYVGGATSTYDPDNPYYFTIVFYGGTKVSLTGFSFWQRQYFSALSYPGLCSAIRIYGYNNQDASDLTFIYEGEINDYAYGWKTDTEFDSATDFYRYFRLEMPEANKDGKGMFTVGRLELYGTIRHRVEISYDTETGTAPGNTSIGDYDNLAAWYRPEDATPTSNITSIPDASGNGMDLDIKTGTGTCTSGTGVFVDGSYHIYLPSWTGFTTTNTSTFDSDFTIYQVLYSTDYSGARYGCSVWDSGTFAAGYFQEYMTRISGYARNTSSGVNAAGGIAEDTGVAHVRTLVADGHSVCTYLDGWLVGAIGRHSQSNSWASVQYQLGMRTISTSQPAYYGQTAIFSEAHDDATRQEIEGILSSATTFNPSSTVEVSGGVIDYLGGSGYTASQYGTYSGRTADLAVDGNPATYSSTNSSTSAYWQVALDPGTGLDCTGFRFVQNPTSGQHAITVIVYGSVHGSVFDTLWSGDLNLGANAETVVSFDPNGTYYPYLKIGWGGSHLNTSGNRILNIAEIDFYGTYGTV